MSLIDSYQEAIWTTLLAEGPLTYNRLYMMTQKTKKCSRNTFQKHLNTLVKNFRILKNKKGVQTVEYSLPDNLSKSTKDTIDILDEYNKLLDEFDIELLSKLIKEYLTKTKKSKRQRKEVFQRWVAMIEGLLKIVKFTSLVIALGIIGKISVIKLKKMRKRSIMHLQQVLDSIGKVDPKLRLVIKIKILNEIELI